MDLETILRVENQGIVVPEGSSGIEHNEYIMFDLYSDKRRLRIGIPAWYTTDRERAKSVLFQCCALPIKNVIETFSMIFDKL